MRIIKVELTEEQLNQLNELIHKTRDAKIRQRLMSIKYLNEGIRKTAVAKLLGVSLKTIYVWLVIYEDRGLDELIKLHYENRRFSCLDGAKEQLAEYMSTNVIHNIWSVVDYVNNTLGIKVGYHGVYRYIKKNLILDLKNQKGFRYKKRNDQYRWTL